MTEKTETVASVREAFEKIKAAHEDWPGGDEEFRMEVTSVGVAGLIGAANTGLPESDERAALIEEMAQWLADSRKGSA
jgi:hypothetical protein